MKPHLWLLAGILLWPLVGSNAEAANPRHRLCCLAEGPHWRLVDHRKCYTDRWRAKSQLQWCMQPEARSVYRFRRDDFQGDSPTTVAPASTIGRQGAPDGHPAPASIPMPREIRTEDRSFEAPPPPAFDPTSMFEAFSDLRRIERLSGAPRVIPGPLPPPHETRHENPPISWGGPMNEPPTPAKKVRLPASNEPETVNEPKTPWPIGLLPFLLALFLLGTAATEDYE
jgi:hypothetical protein